MTTDPRGYEAEIKKLDEAVWTIEVGESRKRWAIHESFLCSNSKFFQAATKKDWDSTDDRIIALIDDDPDAFEVYAQWLYTRRVLVRNRLEDREDPFEEEYKKLIESYILGEKIQDTIFQDVIMDSIIACLDTMDIHGDHWYPIDLPDRVYDGTPDGSPLRKLMVDMFVCNGEESWIDSYKNLDFWHDLAKALFRFRPEPSESSPGGLLRDSRNYHLRKN